MKRFRGTKGIVILVLMMVLVIGYFYYLSNRTISSDKKVPEAGTEKNSPVATVLLRDLEIQLSIHSQRSGQILCRAD